jgi:Holliday junction DNA helicase RuvA
MIASVSGRVASLTGDAAVIEVGGVGILAQITPPTTARLQVGATTTLFTSLVVREESLTLFGFLDDGERILFDLLQTASGVGPKLAQAMLAVLTPDALRRAIIDEDLRTLETVPGIGRKGAQRIVLELKDRIGAPRQASASVHPIGLGWRDQVHSALIGLGFSAREASDAIDAALAEVDSDDVSTILREALRARGR